MKFIRREDRDIIAVIIHSSVCLIPPPLIMGVQLFLECPTYKDSTKWPNTMERSPSRASPGESVPAPQTEKGSKRLHGFFLSRKQTLRRRGKLLEASKKFQQFHLGESRLLFCGIIFKWLPIVLRIKFKL